MNRLNSKGQSLAIFVIFIPVIIMIGTFVVDLSFSKYNKRKLDDVAKLVVKYGLNHIDSNPYDNMVDLIYQNDEVDSYEILVEPENSKVKVSLIKSTKGFFGSIIDREIYKEKSFYVGHIDNDKKIIERDE